MADEVVGAAKITIDPDLTGFSDALLAGVQSAADDAAAALVTAFSSAAATSASELATIGEAGFVDVTATADQAATDLEATFAAAADEADGSLSGIGAGAGADIAAQFDGAGAQIAGQLEEGATEADAALAGIGAGAGDELAAEFSGVGDQIASEVSSGADEASAALAGIGAGAGQASSDLLDLESVGSGVAAAMATSFGGLGKVIAVAAGGLALGKFFEQGERIQSIAGITNTLLETTGNVAGITADEIVGLGDSIEGVSGIESELVQQGANVLLTFKNVRNEVGKGNDIFDRAITAGSDLSTVLGGDMTGASLQLGKALQDPVRGLTLLGRAGVSFTADQKALVKELVAEGDLLSAQKVILDELEGQVGGAAAASAKATDLIRNSIGRVTDEIGLGLVPAADDLAERLPDIVDQLVPVGAALGDTLGQGASLAVDALLALTPLLGTGTALLTALLPVLQLAVTLLEAVPDPVLQIAAALYTANKALLLIKASAAFGLTSLSNLAVPSGAVAGAFVRQAEGAERAAGGLGSLLAGINPVTAAITVATAAFILNQQALDRSRKAGAAWAHDVTGDVDLASLSVSELNELVDKFGVGLDNLDPKTIDSLFEGKKQGSEKIKAAREELAALVEDAEKARIAAEAVLAETAFGAKADQFVGLADGLATVRAESTDAADALSKVRLTGADSDETFLALAATLGDAALSEDAMAGAANALGVEVEDLQGFIEDVNGAVSEFVDTAVQGLPQIGAAFEDTNDSGRVSAREFITGLQADALELTAFFTDLRTITDAGFAEVAGVLAEQGPEIASTAAKQLAAAAREGNTTLLEETQTGLDNRDKVIADSTAYLTNTLGPQYAIATGDVATAATDAFGENFDPAEQIRIAGELARSGLDIEGQRIAAIAATQGDAAARSFGRGLNMDEEAIAAAVAAGKAIRENAPTGAAKTAGVSTGEAFADGVFEGISNRAGAVADKSQQLVLQAEAAARRAARATSPSKLFAELGEDMGSGIAVGLDDAGQVVAKSAQALISGAAAAVSKEAVTIGAGLDPNIGALARSAATIPTGSGESTAAAQGGGQRPIIIERLVLPSTAPEQAAGAVIEGMVTIAQMIGSR